MYRSHPDGTNITKSEHKKFEPKEIQTSSGVQEGAALAPAEGKVQEDTLTKEGERKDIEGLPASFRVPPKTAIAGMLIDRWAKGEMDEVPVDRESVKNRL